MTKSRRPMQCSRVRMPPIATKPGLFYTLDRGWLPLPTSSRLLVACQPAERNRSARLRSARRKIPSRTDDPSNASKFRYMEESPPACHVRLNPVHLATAPQSRASTSTVKKRSWVTTAVSPKRKNTPLGFLVSTSWGFISSRLPSRRPRRRLMNGPAPSCSAKRDLQGMGRMLVPSLVPAR